MKNGTDGGECQNEKSVSGRKSALPLVLILAAGALIRFSFLDRFELWADECSSVLTALSPDFFRALVQENNPPLYYLLLQWWIGLFGMGEFAVRSLSALAGTLAIAAIFFWGWALRLPACAVLWGALFLTLAPLQFHYSQEARAYITATLFLLMSQGFFAGAAVNRRVASWFAHGFFLAAALYTHELILLVVPAFWTAAWILRLDRLVWARFILTHAAVLAAYAPWLLFVRFSAKDQAIGWIDQTTRAGLLLAPLRSFEHFTIGGRMPEYLPLPDPGTLARTSAILVFFILAAVALAKLRRCTGEVSESGSERRKILVLVLFCIMPLILLLAVSFLFRPIYLPGRYDFFAQPAFLLLIGAGAGLMQSIAGSERRRKTAAAWIFLIFCGFASAGLGERLLPTNKAPHRPQTWRGEILQRDGKPGDFVICLGLEGVKVKYQMLLRRINLPMNTFPSDTIDHIGWFNPREVWARGRSMLDEDAMRLLSQNAAGAKRIWLMPDPYSGRRADPSQPAHYYDLISRSFFAQLNVAGFKRVTLPGNVQQQFSRAGILLYEKEDQ